MRCNGLHCAGCMAMAKAGRAGVRAGGIVLAIISAVILMVANSKTAEHIEVGIVRTIMVAAIGFGCLMVTAVGFLTTRAISRRRHRNLVRVGYYDGIPNQVTPRYVHGYQIDSPRPAIEGKVIISQEVKR